MFLCGWLSLSLSVCVCVCARVCGLHLQASGMQLHREVICLPRSQEEQPGAAGGSEADVQSVPAGCLHRPQLHKAIAIEGGCGLGEWEIGREGGCKGRKKKKSPFLMNCFTLNTVWVV